MNTQRRRDLLAVLSALISVSAVASAQDADPAAGPAEQTTDQPSSETPEAAQIFEDYIEAIGGMDAIRAQTFRYLTGTYRGAPFRGGARITLWQQAPNRSHYRFAEPLGMHFDMYCSGEIAWQIEADDQASELTGADRLEVLGSAGFYGESNYAERYAEIRVTGTGSVEGDDVWVIYTKSHLGRERSLMFSMESKLFVAERSMIGGDKEQIVQIVLDRYEDVGGVLYPMRQRQELLGTNRKVEIVYRESSIEEFEHNFDPPADMPRAPAEESESADDSTEASTEDGAEGG